MTVENPETAGERILNRAWLKGASDHRSEHRREFADEIIESIRTSLSRDPSMQKVADMIMDMA